MDSAYEIVAAIVMILVIGSAVASTARDRAAKDERWRRHKGDERRLEQLGREVSRKGEARGHRFGPAYFDLDARPIHERYCENDGCGGYVWFSLAPLDGHSYGGDAPGRDCPIVLDDPRRRARHEADHLSF